MEDDKNGEESGKMDPLELVYCHIGKVPLPVWLHTSAPWDVGRLITRLLRTQCTHHHRLFGTF